MLENKENQLPPGNLPTDPQPATNTDNVTAAVSFPPQCKSEETSQEKEAPTKTGPTTEDVLEVQTRVKMDSDPPSDYGHYKVVDRSPNRKSIRLKLKKILPGKGEDEPSGCTKATSPDQKMTCKICGEDCASFRVLRKHLRCQHPKVKEPTVCDMCGEDCGSLRRLRAHVRSQHPITKVHRCEVCNKEFTQECSLVYHLAFMHSRESALFDFI
ncbi:unnamed protein product [Dibothriocephalus latus]|uniref:C2H2-type domain-containing protein n=1 Tax=Dibothriocephalus latus TaxID=60516 RepID=A0A3P7Q4R6_DIBLA|nr:unnamed protein product [Dibothriocephalus latus]